MELKKDFLLESCGNKDTYIHNHHSLEIAEPELVKERFALICNNDKTNELIGQRNFTCKIPVTFDPRPELTRNCSEMSNNQIPHIETEEYLKDNFLSCNPPLCPGKGDPKRYLLNIDVESSLKNIDYHTTNCKQNIHKLKYDCEDCALSCYKDILHKDYELPQSDIAQCIKGYEFPEKGLPLSNNIYFRNENDTGYDYRNHEICNIGFERIWNNPTKRSMMDERCPYKKN